MVGPIVAATILGSTGAVLILIVVFAALASLLDSLLAATSSLLVEDVYRRVFRPGASGGELRLAARAFVVILGALAVLLCWGRLTTLAETIQFTGAFVASTIWPIAAGLYWPHTNRHSTLAGMVLGTLAGLWAYFGVGFYAAALVGGGVSMLCVAVGSKLYPQSFDWAALTALRPPEDK
jgi:urea-proton symporter